MNREAHSATSDLRAAVRAAKRELLQHLVKDEVGVRNAGSEGSFRLVPAVGASDYPGEDEQDDAHGDRDVPADVMVSLPVEGMAGKERWQ
jgi:hypothetical protein